MTFFKIHFYFSLLGVMGTLFFPGITATAQSPGRTPDKVFCTHPEICNILQELVGQKKITPPPRILEAAIIKGDPHLYDPGTGDIKTLVGSATLVTGPLDLQPWLNKILPLRAHQDKKTFTPTLPAELLQKYRGPKGEEPSREGLAHFWTYPDLLCSMKTQLEKALVDWGFPSGPVACEEAWKLEKELQALAKIPNLPRIIITHDALTPLLTRYGFQILPLKGAGHHHEGSPAQLKKIHQLVAGKNRPKILWVLEKEILHHGEVWARELIKPQDLQISVSTEGRFPEAPEKVLRDFIQELKKALEVPAAKVPGKKGS